MPKGKFLRQVGRKGQGPGEYDMPFYFDVDGQGRIYVLDMRSMRVTRFDPAGKYEVELPAGEDRLPNPGRRPGPDLLRRNVDGRAANLTSEFKIVQRLLTIVRYDADGRNPVRVGPFPSEKMIMKADAGRGGVVSGSSPTAPRRAGASPPTGGSGSGTMRPMTWASSIRTASRSSASAAPIKPVRNKSYDEIALANRKNTVVTEFFPAYAPDFFFDEAGNIWLRMFRNDDKDEPHRYDVFSPQGVYLKQIVLPCRIYQVRNGKMIAVVETEEGFRALKCYQYSKDRPAVPAGDDKTPGCGCVLI